MSEEPFLVYSNQAGTSLRNRACLPVRNNSPFLFFNYGWSLTVYRAASNPPSIACFSFQSIRPAPSLGSKTPELRNSPSKLEALFPFFPSSERHRPGLHSLLRLTEVFPASITRVAFSYFPASFHMGPFPIFTPIFRSTSKLVYHPCLFIRRFKMRCFSFFLLSYFRAFFEALAPSTTCCGPPSRQDFTQDRCSCSLYEQFSTVWIPFIGRSSFFQKYKG